MCGTEGKAMYGACAYLVASEGCAPDLEGLGDGGVKHDLLCDAGHVCGLRWSMSGWWVSGTGRERRWHGRRARSFRHILLQLAGAPGTITCNNHSMSIVSFGFGILKVGSVAECSIHGLVDGEGFIAPSSGRTYTGRRVCSYLLQGYMHGMVHGTWDIMHTKQLESGTTA